MVRGRQLTIVIAVAIVAAIVTYGVQQSRDSVYESEALLAVEAPSALGADSGRPENVVFMARTYATRAHVTPVVDDALERSTLEMSREAIRRDTSARVSNQDATITLRSRATDPEDAQALTSALAAALQDYVRAEQVAVREERLVPLEDRVAEVEQELAVAPAGSPRSIALEREYQALVAERAAIEVAPLDRIVLLSPPELPSAPVSPRPVRDALIAFFLAGALGAEAIIGWRMFRSDRADAVSTAEG